MKRNGIWILVAAMVVPMMIVQTAAAQGDFKSGSDVEFGAGVSLTNADSGDHAANTFMPIFAVAGDQFGADFGFALRFGEDVTNFMLQIGGAYYPLELLRGQVGFGIQFGLDSAGSSVAVPNRKPETNSVILFGLYAEYRARISESFSAGVKLFPLQLVSTKDYSRIGVFTPGASLVLFF